MPWKTFSMPHCDIHIHTSISKWCKKQLWMSAVTRFTEGAVAMTTIGQSGYVEWRPLMVSFRYAATRMSEVWNDQKSENMNHVPKMQYIQARRHNCFVPSRRAHVCADSGYTFRVKCISKLFPIFDCIYAWNFILNIFQVILSFINQT